MNSRANGYPSYRGSSRTTRPSSAELVDLHVYIVPPDLWREHYNNLLNQNVTETISAGIIRVHPEAKVYSLREEIDQQIGVDLLPQDYVFLKSVGRSITRLKPKQEYQLKAKHFIPPQAYAPELYLLEVGPGDSRGSTQPQSPSTISQQQQPYHNNQHYHESEDGSQTGKSRQMHSTSSPYRYSPLPKIRQSRTPVRGHSQKYDNGNHNGDMGENAHASKSWDPSSNRSPPQTERSPERSPPRREHRSHHGSPTQRKGSSRGGSPHNDERSRGGKQSREGRHSRGGRQSREGSPHHGGSTRRDSPHHHNSARGRSPPPKGVYSAGRRSTSPIHSSTDRDRSRKGRSPAKGEKYDGMYTNNTNEDSGINVITPENRYEDMDRRKPEEDSHPDVHARFRAVDDDENDRQRNMNGDQDDGEWERRRQEEEERRRREEEENRRREEEDRRREEEERRRREDERDKMTKDQKLTGSDEDLNRFPSPPPLRVADDHLDRDTESAKRRRKEEKERLMRELEQAREARRAIERQREELVKKAKAMQSKTQNRRNHARDVWKKRYFEEKKKTPPLEEHCNRLRHELDIIHRKLMNTLEGPSKDKSTRGGADMKPSQKNNYKIQATRLTHEIDDMRRRLENAKMKLTAEMKLRNQAETELRALRAELTQKKIHLTLTRNQQLAAMTPGTNQEMFMMPALSHRS